MRKIIGYCLVSLDGVFDEPDPVQMGFRDYEDDAYLRDRLGVFEACEAALWGRKTYERFATMYAGREVTIPYVASLNAMRKYVFSSTLKTAAWNNSTIIQGDVATAVTKLKQQEGGDLLILGHGLLCETLLKERLLDVLDIAIHPIMAGHGKPLLREGQAVKLKLTATKVFSKIVKLTYEPQY
jgi:dihydrofolate reductase